MKLIVDTYIHKRLQQLTVKIICNVAKTIISVLFFIQRKINKKINKLRIGRRTNAVYCSSSFVRAASSSNLFSKVNQRSSAIRGRSEGKLAEEFAILEIWTSHNIPLTLKQCLHVPRIDVYEVPAFEFVVFYLVLFLQYLIPLTYEILWIFK